MTNNDKEFKYMYQSLYELNKTNIAQFQKQLKPDQLVLVEQIGLRLIDEIVHRTSTLMTAKKDLEQYSYYQEQFKILFLSSPPANTKLNS